MSWVHSLLNIKICCIVLLIATECLTMHHLECKDTSRFCKQWAKEGKCEVAGFLKQCPKSCDVCNNPSFSDELLQSAAHTKNVLIIFSSILILGGVIIVIKLVNLGEMCRSKGTLKGKTVIITGATSGIGLETAYHLAARGAHVILGCRNLKKGFKTAQFISQHTGKNLIEIKKLDLTSFDSVRSFAADINAEYEQIDILINNAAMISSSGKNITKNGNEESFQVNYLSHFLLTKLLLEKLKDSQSSRIINIVDKATLKEVIDLTDLQYKNNYFNLKVYKDSKVALMMFTQELSELLHNTNITVNAVHPGKCFSSLYKNIFPYNLKLAWPFISFYAYIFWKNASLSAETTYYCALEQSLQKTSGKYFEECSEKEISKFDRGLVKKLWLLSEDLIEGDNPKQESFEDVWNRISECSRSSQNNKNKIEEKSPPREINTDKKND